MAHLRPPVPGRRRGPIRRIISAVLLAALLPAGAACPSGAAGEAGTPFASCITGREEIRALTAGKTENRFEARILVNNTPVIYDEQSNTMYCPLAGGSLQDASVSVGDARLCAVADPASANGLSFDAVIVSDRYYFESKLVFTPLPVLHITGVEGKIRSDYVPVRITLYDNSGKEVRTVSSGAKIRIRGKSSRSYKKKNYRIQLLTESGGKNKEDLLGLRKDDDWVLYAAYNDPEKIRNVFSSNLWFTSCARSNPYGVTAGMEYRFLELFQDNRYQGLYALGFPIDDRQFKSGSGKCSGLFEVSYHEGVEADAELNDEPLPGYDLKTKDCDEKALWRRLRETFRTANTADSPSEVWECIDRGSAIDIFLFCGLTQAVDTANKNTFRNMYLALMDDGRMLYMPWDLDQTFGAAWVGKKEKNKTATYSMKPSYNVTMKQNPVYRFLGADGMREAVRERYRLLRRNEWSEESISAALDEYERLIYGSGAYEREKERWPDGTYSEEDVRLDRFREYVIQRLSFMDAWVDGL